MAAFQKVSEVQDPLESTKGCGFIQIFFLGCLFLISSGTVVCCLPLGPGFESTGWLRSFCVKFVYSLRVLPFTIPYTQLVILKLALAVSMNVCLSVVGL